MRSSILILLLFGSLIHCYDIQEIVQALSEDFSLEQGGFNLFNISDCANTPTCSGINIESTYLWYNFSSWGGSFGHLREDEAIIAIQPAPPACLYYGFTPYIYTRSYNSYSKILFASLSDTMNMNTITKGSDGTISLVISANLNTTKVISYILEKFLPPNATNLLPLPGQLLNLGTDPSADTFSVLSRYALFQNQNQGQNYLRNLPGYVYKVTPKVQQDDPILFPIPNFRQYGPTTKNENFLQTTLTALVAAIRYSETGAGLLQPAVDVEHLIDYQNGFTCINKSIDCFGDNRDTRFLRGGSIYIQNSTDSHTWIAGVQHQLTAKATYVAVSAYDEVRQLGVLTVPHTKLAGSAQKFLPNNPDAYYLYAIKFARSCAVGDSFCFVVPVDFPGVPLDSTISFVERMFVEPGYNVGPAYGSIINPQFIRYKSMPSSVRIV